MPPNHDSGINPSGRFLAQVRKKRRFLKAKKNIRSVNMKLYPYSFIIYCKFIHEKERKRKRRECVSEIVRENLDTETEQGGENREIEYKNRKE